MSEIELPIELKRIILDGAEETKLGDRKGAQNNTERETCTFENMKINLQFTQTG